jgi:Tol biopolymer transport system component
VILFSSYPLEDVGPSFGFPTVVQLDGSQYHVLDDSQVSYALPAPSPDGRTVAYDRSGKPWLYRQDAGPEPFDWTLYGLPGDRELRIVSPAWSPDGRRLAWVVNDCSVGACQTSVGVFDLEAKTAQLLHPYTPVGRGGQPLAPAWSPDGRWLAFTAEAMNPDDAGFWIVRADGQQDEEYPLATGHVRATFAPVWSPDGRRLAVSSVSQGGELEHWVAEVGTWELHPLDLPPDAHIVDWTG